MKIKHALAILCCTPALLLAQGNMLSGESDDVEIIKEPEIHPFDTTQAFVLGMQLARHYYYTLLTVSPYIGYTTYFQIYSDAQIVIRDFIRNPIRLTNIHLHSVEQYYGSLLLLLYHEAHQRANDASRHEYERHLEAAVLYRTAYLVGTEYIEENEEGEETSIPTIPFLLEQLDAQAVNEERYLANLIAQPQNMRPGYLAPPNTPQYLSEDETDIDEFDDLPELEAIDEGLTATEFIEPDTLYATWPPNNPTLRDIVFSELTAINAEGSMF